MSEPSVTRNTVLAYLDGLSDDAAAHIYPSDLEKCMTSECVVEVVSVRAGNGDESTVPLFSREQVVAALAAAPAQTINTVWPNCVDANLIGSPSTSHPAIGEPPAQQPWHYTPPAQERIQALELEVRQLTEQVAALRHAPTPQAAQPVEDGLRIAVDAFWSAYHNKFARVRGDIRADAPLLEEVKAMRAAMDAPPPLCDSECLYATPQPTQAQAGAVPLTDAQSHALIERMANEAEQWAEGLSYEPTQEQLSGWCVAFIQREIHFAHGIKQGGQHG